MTAPAALAAFMPSMISSAVVSESAAKMPPEWNHCTPPAKIAFQSKSPGLSSAAGLVRAVVEDDRGADAVAAVAVDGGDVRPADAVVLELLVERRDAHLADAGLHQFADAGS